MQKDKNKKLRKNLSFFHGWGDRIRTYACGSQNPEPYRLATPQYKMVEIYSTIKLLSKLLKKSSVIYKFLLCY